MAEPLVLVDTSMTAPIQAPIEDVDLAHWLFHLTDEEYQRCAPGQHIAAGTTTTEDGRPLSINVELIGGSLIVQHYIAETLDPHHCLLVSLSDSYPPGGHTKVGVIWELTAAPDETGQLALTNRVMVHTTDEFLDFLAEHAVPFEAAAKERGAAVTAHNALETPLYALSIARHATSRTDQETGR